MSALVHRDPAAALDYVDRHFDLNTPDSTTDGALDWMGMGAAFDLLPEPPDFIGMPLAENTDGRNSGPTLPRHRHC